MKWNERLWVAAVIYEICIVAPAVIVIGPSVEALLSLGLGEGSWALLSNMLIILALTGLFGMALLLIMGLIDYAKR